MLEPKTGVHDFRRFDPPHLPSSCSALPRPTCYRVPPLCATLQDASDQCLFRLPPVHAGIRARPQSTLFCRYRGRKHSSTTYPLFASTVTFRTLSFPCARACATSHTGTLFLAGKPRHRACTVSCNTSSAPHSSLEQSYRPSPAEPRRALDTSSRCPHSLHTLALSVSTPLPVLVHARLSSLASARNSGNSAFALVSDLIRH